MRPKPAKLNKQVVATTPEGEAMAGSQSGPAILRQPRIFPATFEVTSASAFAGPLPPPDLLAKYERAHPGLADRIVAMAEAEGEHRRALQQRAIRLSELGLAAAFVIAMTALGGGIYLVHEGSSREGMGSILLAISSLVLVFLTRGKRHAGDAPHAPGK
jgi:uncharacterized membrane protein